MRVLGYDYWRLLGRPVVVSVMCEEDQAHHEYLLKQADDCPMLSPGPYGGGRYRSPSYSVYLSEASYVRWKCANGNHVRPRIMSSY